MNREGRQRTANSEGDAEIELVSPSSTQEKDPKPLLRHRCFLTVTVIAGLYGEVLTIPFRRLNTSPATLDDKEVLKKHLTEPPVKKIDLHFPLGLEVTARNLKGVTIKDALDAIHKQFKKKVCLCSAFSI